jgi:hypothetical protein
MRALRGGSRLAAERSGVDCSRSFVRRFGLRADGMSRVRLTVADRCLSLYYLLFLPPTMARGRSSGGRRSVCPPLAARLKIDRGVDTVRRLTLSLVCVSLVQLPCSSLCPDSDPLVQLAAVACPGTGEGRSSRRAGTRLASASPPGALARAGPARTAAAGWRWWNAQRTRRNGHVRNGLWNWIGSV